jgi:hypothetical protein
MELEELAPRLSAADVDGRGRGGAAAADPGRRAGELKEEGLVQGAHRRGGGGGGRPPAEGGGRELGTVERDGWRWATGRRDEVGGS